ncbi:hypothetical protein BDV11DRAFT_200497 [Aspergillus similis]
MEQYLSISKPYNMFCLSSIVRIKLASSIAGSAISEGYGLLTRLACRFDCTPCYKPR